MFRNITIQNMQIITTREVFLFWNENNQNLFSCEGKIDYVNKVAKFGHNRKDLL
jgi:hypothetical protein